MSYKEQTESIKKSLRKIINEHSLVIDVFVDDKKIDVVLQFSEAQNINQQQITKDIKDAIILPKEVRVIFTAKKEEKKKYNIPNIEKIILSASAKGGVGKSTTTVNIANAIARKGFRVGIVDADIYGPTIPKLLGISQKPNTEDGKMLPIEKNGIYSISIGYIVDESKAAIWRGPMVSKALYQLLIGVKWPKLDYLIIDMPPGTGDIYLSLAENFIIDGAVLITTPQNISLSIVQKSISFFEKTNIPIIGIIENMSYFLDEKSNVKHHIFGPSITEAKIDCKFLGHIPLIAKISEFSDKGMILDEESYFGIYLKIVEKILNSIEER